MVITLEDPPYCLVTKNKMATGELVRKQYTISTYFKVMK